MNKILVALSLSTILMADACSESVIKVDSKLQVLTVIVHGGLPASERKLAADSLNTAIKTALVDCKKFPQHVYHLNNMLDLLKDLP